MTTSMKQRLGHPATRAVAQGKRRDFSPALAACGGGHIPVPGVARVKFHGSRVGSPPPAAGYVPVPGPPQLTEATP